MWSLNNIISYGYHDNDKHQINIKIELSKRTTSNGLKLKLYREILKKDIYNTEIIAQALAVSKKTGNQKEMEFFLKQWTKSEPGNEKPYRALMALYNSQKNNFGCFCRGERVDQAAIFIHFYSLLLWQNVGICHQVSQFISQGEEVKIKWSKIVSCAFVIVRDHPYLNIT